MDDVSEAGVRAYQSVDRSSGSSFMTTLYPGGDYDPHLIREVPADVRTLTAVVLEHVEEVLSKNGDRTLVDLRERCIYDVSQQLEKHRVARRSGEYGLEDVDWLLECA